MLTLMMKGVFSLLASFLLIATTAIDSLCAALRRLHVPGILVTLLLLTYRYIGVMLEQVSVMTEAYRLRAPGQKGLHISAWEQAPSLQWRVHDSYPLNNNLPSETDKHDFTVLPAGHGTRAGCAGSCPG